MEVLLGWEAAARSLCLRCRSLKSNPMSCTMMFILLLFPPFAWHDDHVTDSSASIIVILARENEAMLFFSVTPSSCKVSRSIDAQIWCPCLLMRWTIRKAWQHQYKGIDKLGGGRLQWIGWWRRKNTQSKHKSGHHVITWTRCQQLLKSRVRSENFRAIHPIFLRYFIIYLIILEVWLTLDNIPILSCLEAAATV